MNTFHIVIIFFLLTAFAGCRDNPFPVVTDKKLLEWNRLKNQKHISPSISSPVGKWHYSVFFFSAELVIQPDGKFDYYTVGCLGKGFATGDWESNGNIVLLNSENSLNDLPVDFTVDAIQDSVARLETVAYPIYFRDYSVVLNDKSQLFSGPSVIEINHLRFQLIGDKLVELDSSGRLTERKFVQVKGEDYKSL